jgi:hypothetical protein
VGSIARWLRVPRVYFSGGTAMPESEIVFAVEESPEGGYEAHAPGYSIFTEAESLPELRSMVRDAVRCHFDDASRPKVIRLHLVRE